MCGARGDTSYNKQEYTITPPHKFSNTEWEGEARAINVKGPDASTLYNLFTLQITFLVLFREKSFK
mgnify:CR=1 FL=1